MPQLIAHLIGDYCLQNHYMATQKTKAWFPALLHVLLYGIPFIVIGASLEQWFLIVSTHYLIDRYRLAKYWVVFWGIGVEGFVLREVAWWKHFRAYPEPAFGEDSWGKRTPPDEAPPFLAVWLLILVDNTMHLAINCFALGFL